jgi:hypothetical protein
MALNISSAIYGTAATRQFPIVMGFSIIAGELLSLLYFSQRIKLYFTISSAHISIRIAGMIDIG